MKTMGESLREQIIDNAASERFINRVSPIYNDSFVGLWLYEIMGKEFQVAWDILDSFPAQFIPETATWSLPLWERRYGIESNYNLSIEERRSKVIEKRDNHRPYNNYRLETWLKEKSGCDVTIIDNISSFTFGIVFDSDHGIKPGFSQVDAVKYINQNKPSHMSYQFQHNSNLRKEYYVGIVLYGACDTEFDCGEGPDLSEIDYLTDEAGNILLDERGVALMI